jgi:hypothetical protein
MPFFVIAVLLPTRVRRLSLFRYAKAALFATIFAGPDRTLDLARLMLYTFEFSPSDAVWLRPNPYEP